MTVKTSELADRMWRARPTRPDLPPLHCRGYFKYHPSRLPRSLTQILPRLGLEAGSSRKQVCSTRPRRRSRFSHSHFRYVFARGCSYQGDGPGCQGFPRAHSCWYLLQYLFGERAFDPACRYFDNDPIIELIVVPVWSPAHAGAGILSTFSQVCRSYGSMRLFNPCSCFYCTSDPRWLKVVVAALLLLETANSFVAASVGEPIGNRYKYDLPLKFALVYDYCVSDFGTNNWAFCYQLAAQIMSRRELGKNTRYDSW